MAPESTPTQVTLRRGDDGVIVVATVIIGTMPLTLDPLWLFGALREAGLSGAVITRDGIARLQRMLASGTSGEVEIGTFHDAQIAIQISPDKFAATLILTTARGGMPATREAVMEQVAEAGLADDLVDGAAIDGLLLAAASATPGSTLQALVAQGTVAVDGRDSRFEPLVPVSDRRPARRADDSLDYRDLGVIPSVEQGAALMRRHPPTPGASGRMVTGEVVKAADGRPRKFGKCRGAVVSSTDPNLLVASITGQPVVQPRGVSVDSVLRLNNVDLSTGHIEYDGSLIIQDSITPCMRVKVTGDVQVLGAVESAELDIGGNLDVRMGILGSAASGEDDSLAMRVCCAGNLSAGHIENAILEIAGDVFVRSQISHCRLISGGRVIVGSSGQKRSGIVGGCVQAASLIRAQSLGAEAGIRTRIAIVCASSMLERFAQLEEMIDIKQVELGRIVRSMAGLSRSKEANVAARVARANADCAYLKQQLADLAGERDRLKAQVERCYRGRIEVPGVAFPQVTVAIGDQSEETTQSIERIVFVYGEGHLGQDRFDPSSSVAGGR